MVVLLSVASLAGCSTATRSGPPARGPGAGPGATEETPPAEELERALDVRLVLERVDSLVSTGAGTDGARVADSAYFRWSGRAGRRRAALRALLAEARALESTGRPETAEERLRELLDVEPPPPAGIRRVAVRRLAEIRLRLALDPQAVELVAGHSEAWTRQERRELLARVGARMSRSELVRAVGRLPDGSPEAATVGVELARALALSGRADSARRVAERSLGGDLTPEQRAVADSVRSGTVGPADRGSLRVGVVLPLSGPLASVGRLLEDGVRVALEELASSADSALIEVEVHDDSSDAGRAVQLLEELESGGAVAVMGPVRSDAFAHALESRTDRGLVLVSPTAMDVPEESWNAYSLWTRDERRLAATRAVSGWLTEEAGLARLGVLRPRDAAGREAELDFRAGARRGGGFVVAATSYSPDSTTFESAVRPLAAAAPEATYLSAPDVRTALQLAPQLSYYGLRTALVAGDLTWGEPPVVRRLQGGFPSRWIAAVLVDRGEGTRWDEFRQKYEVKFDKPLLNNMLAPLSYDAMQLILEAARRVALPRRGAVARALLGGPASRTGSLEGYEQPTDAAGHPTREGVTGRFTVVRGRAGIRRQAEVRLAGPGGMVRADSGAAHRWRRQAATLQEARQRRRRALAAGRVDRWVEEQGDSGS